jgi:hypothetical protein
MKTVLFAALAAILLTGAGAAVLTTEKAAPGCEMPCCADESGKPQATACEFTPENCGACEGCGKCEKH